MRNEARKLIEEQLQKDHPGTKLSALNEVVTRTNDEGCTTMLPDSHDAAKQIVERHFKAMSEELEAGGFTFDASVSDDYARLRFGGSNGQLA